MPNWSLRVWLFVVSTLFAMLVVGGIALTTYVIVTEGMEVVAGQTTDRVATAATAVVNDVAAESELAAAVDGTLTAQERARRARELFMQRLPDELRRTGFSQTEFALYDDELVLVWTSEPNAVSETEPERLRAVESGALTSSIIDRGSLLAGLLREAQLSVSVSHLPITLPGGGVGVLDVKYVPASEEAVIDNIRAPMAVLAVCAMFIMVVLMQTSMVWVLNLVDDLRKAADSIDAGRLDERLPDTGANEIGELARSLNRLIERLQRRANAQSRFVADASHELATPVAGIRGYTTILRAWGGEDPKVREEAIDAIDRESRRMARLTSDLLNLLHADQGLVLKSERFDLNGVCRERLAATASRYLDKDIEFVGPEEDSLLMVGDADRIEDVISILLDNAAKYTPQGGAVTVWTARQKDEVFIDVSDTGLGIAPDELPRLFDRFFRSEKARAEGEGGFGLGLAIAKSIIDSMGGTIWVESEIGVGTSFHIVLPRGRV